jgi:hypothetical protein
MSDAYGERPGAANAHRHEIGGEPLVHRAPLAAFNLTPEAITECYNSKASRMGGYPDMDGGWALSSGVRI